MTRSILLIAILYFAAIIFLDAGTENQIYQLVKNNTFQHSIHEWDTIETVGHFSLLTMHIDHHSHGPWYVPSLHDKLSIGWNRLTKKGFLNKPFACNIRFFGVAFEDSTLMGFQKGGTGYLTIGFVHKNKKKYWYGFDKNETNQIACYYMTNKDYGSEFLDTPKTLGIAVYCPILMDDEIGTHDPQNAMVSGHFCRNIMDYRVELEVHLRQTQYQPPESASTSNSSDSKLIKPIIVLPEIMADMVTLPQGDRSGAILESMRGPLSRPHAVCTVQTFVNGQSGPMLYLFVSYYQQLGWRVIVFDRFGMHRQFLIDLIDTPGFDYHPYTVYQLAQPSKYNSTFATKQDSQLKFFYEMEKRWGYSGIKADTADQDADKARTYDYCRLEYAHQHSILYVDADELLYCPQAPRTVEGQRHHQHKLMTSFASQGVQEMRFARIPYSGQAPKGFVNTVASRSNTDFTNHTQHCMQAAFVSRSTEEMLKCWSSATSYDNFPKSADFASVCPFHYNHWSCDGMLSGGRDAGKNIPRCRCKVSFDMMNGFEYKPLLRKCHLAHLNDNKYRFQSKREKHIHDKGDIFSYIPLIDMYRATSGN